jgi:hypothetical protein
MPCDKGFEVFEGPCDKGPERWKINPVFTSVSIMLIPCKATAFLCLIA